ncbi:MAG: pro-sigmaK processing inhibitor BofA family protein [Oscillospiraceae bacterium]|nr:pro-sigmaK processing inhibitor BofA family protein [Oscillospiraceae bacterium]
MTIQLQIVLYVLVGAAALAVLLMMLRSKRLLRNFLLTAASGIAALYAVNVVGLLTGTRLSINFLTLGVSAIGGAPGVVGLLLMDTLL